MKANEEIEAGQAASLNISVKAVKEGKAYFELTNSKAWPPLNEKAVLVLNNLDWKEHMGLKYLEIKTESGEVVWLPKEKWLEIWAWILEQKKKQEGKK